jgi:hypothetical protein
LGAHRRPLTVSGANARPGPDYPTAGCRVAEELLDFPSPMHPTGKADVSQRSYVWRDFDDVPARFLPRSDHPITDPTKERNDNRMIG